MTNPSFQQGDRLVLGCGGKPIQGWVNTDGVPGLGPDGVVDVADPQLPPATFAAIYGSHVLEHCWASDTPRILSALRQALQPGGTLRLSVPDLRLVVANCLDSQVYGSDSSALSVIFGATYSAGDAAPDRHRQAFWRERLEHLLLEAGFVRVREWRKGQYPEIDAARDYSTHPCDDDGRSTISLNLEADNPGELPRTSALSRSPVDVSVILGTVDRVAMLRECVGSVRASLAGSGLGYEIVVAYGTEDELSLPWMREQGDIRPVLGGMEGAIPAFNLAYEQSRGRLICQINDDLIVNGDSIPRAVSYLDDHPDCAGVVFKMELGGTGTYRNQFMGRVLHPNQMVVRRETCEAVAERIGAFWGDAAHRTDKTYGGDSAFGAVCHYLGLRLDAVDGVTCRDRCHESLDALRTRNALVAPDHMERWGAAYRPMLRGPAVTPGPDEWPAIYLPRPGMAPRRSPVEAGRPLRLLHLSLRIPSEPLVDMRRALACIGPTVELPWHNHESRMLEAAASRPDVVFAQIQSNAWTSEMSERLRQAAGPDATLVLWSGDVRTSGQQPVERWLVAAGQHFDLMLFDSTTYPRKLALDERVPAACGYLGCGIDPALNPWEPGAGEDGPAVFLGTNYAHLDGGERERILYQVSDQLYGQLAIYGHGWGGSRLEAIARPFVGQAEASRIMRRAPVTISMSLFQDLERYSSDRLKRALCSGAVVALRPFPEMAGLGLEPGKNCLTWQTAEDLVDLLRTWSAPGRAGERLEIRRRAAELGHARFPWDRTVEELLAIVRDHRARKGLL